MFGCIDSVAIVCQLNAGNAQICKPNSAFKLKSK